LLGHSPPPAPRTIYRELTERQWQTAIDTSGDACWKVVRRARADDRGTAAATELYDLAADEAEAHDVAAAHPDVVRRMERLLDREHLPDPAWPLPFADAAVARADADPSLKP
jgi:hypothetical protein